MRVPVITGIGHEPDVSIADLVADRRASTPTAAAEAAVPDRSHVAAVLGRSAASMRRNVAAAQGVQERTLSSIRRLPLYRGSDYLLGRFMQRSDRQAARLPGSPRRGLDRARHRLRVAAGSATYRRSEELMAGPRAQVSSAASGLLGGIEREVERKKGTLERVRTKAVALSPLAVLKRGYSITFDKASGAVVRSSSEVDAGASLNIKLADGSLDAEVTGKE
jgi:exodeoxyribonuclease VII large subunit